MEFIQPPDVAKLVYDYLISGGFKEAAKTFVQTSDDITECLRVTPRPIEMNRHVKGRTLVQNLNLLMQVIAIVQDRAEKVSTTLRDASLVDQLCQLLDGKCVLAEEEKSRCIHCNRGFTCSLTPAISAEQNGNHPLGHSAPSTSDDNIRQTVLKQTLSELQDNTELQEKIAAKINKVIVSPEKEKVARAKNSKKQNDASLETMLNDILDELLPASIAIADDCRLPGNEKVDKRPEGDAEDQSSSNERTARIGQKGGTVKSRLRSSKRIQTKGCTRIASQKVDINDTSKPTSLLGCEDSLRVSVTRLEDSQASDRFSGEGPPSQSSESLIDKAWSMAGTTPTEAEQAETYAATQSIEQMDICFVDVNDPSLSSPNKTAHLTTVPTVCQQPPVLLPQSQFKVYSVMPSIATPPSNNDRTPLPAVIVCENIGRSPQNNIYTGSECKAILTHISQRPKNLRIAPNPAQLQHCKPSTSTAGMSSPGRAPIRTGVRTRGGRGRIAVQGGGGRKIGRPSHSPIVSNQGLRRIAPKINMAEPIALPNGVQIQIVNPQPMTVLSETKSELQLPELILPKLESPKKGNLKIALPPEDSKNTDLSTIIEDRETPDQTCVHKNEKRLTQSTPRRSHIRALDFNTPLKKFMRRANTSPKNDCCRTSPRRSNKVKRSNLFDSPPSKKVEENIKSSSNMSATSQSPLSQSPKLSGGWGKVNGVELIVDTKKTAESNKPQPSWDAALRSICTENCVDQLPPSKVVSKQKSKTKKRNKKDSVRKESEHEKDTKNKELINKIIQDSINIQDKGKEEIVKGKEPLDKEKTFSVGMNNTNSIVEGSGRKLDNAMKSLGNGNQSEGTTLPVETVPECVKESQSVKVGSFLMPCDFSCSKTFDSNTNRIECLPSLETPLKLDFTGVVPSSTDTPMSKIMKEHCRIPEQCLVTPTFPPTPLRVLEQTPEHTRMGSISPVKDTAVGSIEKNSSGSALENQLIEMCNQWETNKLTEKSNLENKVHEQNEGYQTKVVQTQGGNVDIQNKVERRELDVGKGKEIMGSNIITGNNVKALIEEAEKISVVSNKKIIVTVKKKIDDQVKTENPCNIARIPTEAMNDVISMNKLSFASNKQSVAESSETDVVSLYRQNDFVSTSNCDHILIGATNKNNTGQNKDMVRSTKESIDGKLITSNGESYTIRKGMGKSILREYISKKKGDSEINLKGKKTMLATPVPFNTKMPKIKPLKKIVKNCVSKEGDVENVKGQDFDTAQVHSLAALKPSADRSQKMKVQSQMKKGIKTRTKKIKIEKNDIIADCLKTAKLELFGSDTSVSSSPISDDESVFEFPAKLNHSVSSRNYGSILELCSVVYTDESSIDCVVGQSKALISPNKGSPDKNVIIEQGNTDNKTEKDSLTPETIQSVNMVPPESGTEDQDIFIMKSKTKYKKTTDSNGFKNSSQKGGAKRVSLKDKARISFKADSEVPSGLKALAEESQSPHKCIHNLDSVSSMFSPPHKSPIGQNSGFVERAATRNLFEEDSNAAMSQFSDDEPQGSQKTQPSTVELANQGSCSASQSDETKNRTSKSSDKRNFPISNSSLLHISNTSKGSPKSQEVLKQPNGVAKHVDRENQPQTSENLPLLTRDLIESPKIVFLSKNEAYIEIQYKEINYTNRPPQTYDINDCQTSYTLEDDVKIVVSVQPFITLLDISPKEFTVDNIFRRHVPLKTFKSLEYKQKCAVLNSLELCKEDEKSSPKIQSYIVNTCKNVHFDKDTLSQNKGNKCDVLNKKKENISKDDCKIEFQKNMKLCVNGLKECSAKYNEKLSPKGKEETILQRNSFDTSSEICADISKDTASTLSSKVGENYEKCFKKSQSLLKKNTDYLKDDKITSERKAREVVEKKTSRDKRSDRNEYTRRRHEDYSSYDHRSARNDKDRLEMLHYLNNYRNTSTPKTNFRYRRERTPKHIIDSRSKLGRKCSFQERKYRDVTNECSRYRRRSRSTSEDSNDMNKIRSQRREHCKDQKDRLIRWKEIKLTRKRPRSPKNRLNEEINTSDNHRRQHSKMSEDDRMQTKGGIEREILVRDDNSRSGEPETRGRVARRDTDLCEDEDEDEILHVKHMKAKDKNQESRFRREEESMVRHDKAEWTNQSSEQEEGEIESDNESQRMLTHQRLTILNELQHLPKKRKILSDGLPDNENETKIKHDGPQDLLKKLNVDHFLSFVHGNKD